ncbi:S-layer protein [Parageobacillus thermoglucosidasius]|uniref:S-layer homology domain-containing protein n=1 Tax=Parageobacillus thermoglucosidasius TaxID=1426 RepID=UPI000F621043|nr:S-layer homology domain-containing protein [Parageobacillus thermoglucosidasius]GCD81078.1 S-layer protein [Parageobacillus thermoglucosidasius]
MAYQPKSYRKFLAGSVSAALVATAVGPVVANAASFSDVNPNDSHAANINALVELGYIKGFADGTFKPYQSITRGQVAKIFARILTDQGFQAPDKTEQVFDDVPLDAKDQELVKAAAIVKAAGVMTGSQGKLNPAQNITREQMAKVLVEAFDLTKPADFTSKITDLDKADPSFRDYIQTLEANGVTVVTEYRPKDSVTRAAFASFVKRALDVSSVVTADDITAVKFVDENTLEVTFNGELKEVKKEDFAIEGVEIDSVSIKAAASAESKTTVVVIKTKTKLEEGKTYTISYKGKTTDKAKVEVPVVTPKVESVSAINAKQIQVTFNVPVEKTTALNKDNYKIQTNTDASPVSLAAKDASANVELSADGKTVTITTSTDINTAFGGITAGTPFKFTVENLKSANGKEIEKYTTTLVSDDKVAPTLVNVKAEAKSTTTKVTLEFSEPVQTTGAIAYVDGEAATVQAGSKPNEIVLTTAQALSANKTYSLTLLNFKDFAGNFLKENPTTTQFTVVSDTVAPVVQEVKVVRDNLIEVTFDKAMDVATFASNARVLDLNGIQRDGGIVATVKPNTGGKTIRLALQGTVPFNDSGTFVGTLVLGDGIKDVNGNAKVATSHSVTITKDTVRPIITGTTYVAPGGQYSGSTYNNGAIVVKFSEEVAFATSTDIKLVTSTGVDTSTSLNIASRSVNTNDPTEVIIPLTGGLTAGNYTLRIGNDVVQDLSTQANKNVAATTTVKVDSSSDTVKPVVSATPVSVTAATNQTSGSTIVINMTDNVGLDLATVQDVNNYLLDGKPLPSGSYITVAHNPGSSDAAAKDINVTINIPAQSITKDGNYTLNINNIKDKAGNTADPKVATVALKDDVSPELKTATISSNGLLVLGFTEDVNAVTTGSSTDFQFVINGTEVAVANNANIVSFADGTGTDTGKYVVTFNARVDAGADGNSNTTADNRLFLDVNGNTLYDSGDILVQTGTTKAVGTTTLDLNLLSSLKVKVVGNTTVKDTSTLANPIKVGTTITVK